MRDQCRRPRLNDRISIMLMLAGLVLLNIFLWAVIIGAGYLIIELIWGWPR
jgi:hypothetical protein